MFIRTPRLFLRPAWVEDAAALAAALSDGEVARQTALIPHPYGVDDARGFAQAIRPVDEPQFLIFARTEGAAHLVGGIGFGRPDGVLELGYWIDAAHRGQGYATEAGRAMLELAFEGLRRPYIHSGHFDGNTASARVLHKLGFEVTGTRSLRRAAQDQPVPSQLMRLTADAWRGAQAMPMAA